MNAVVVATSCGNCPMAQVDRGEDGFWCNACHPHGVGRIEDGSPIPTWCPLRSGPITVDLDESEERVPAYAREILLASGEEGPAPGDLRRILVGDPGTPQPPYVFIDGVLLDLKSAALSLWGPPDDQRRALTVSAKRGSDEGIAHQQMTSQWERGAQVEVMVRWIGDDEVVFQANVFSIDVDGSGSTFVLKSRGHGG